MKKKKNARQSKETVIKCEEAILKAFEIELGSAVMKNDDETRGTKRKNFDELNSKMSKIARVKNVIEILDSDRGLEEKVLDKLEVRKMTGKSEDDFELSCLSLMKTMGISNTKYDDLRFWVRDMVRRRMDLSSMPTSKQLMEKVQSEMLPGNMKTTETGASVPLVDALYHTVERFLLRLIHYLPLYFSLSFHFTDLI